jgi:hypothetical protein
MNSSSRLIASVTRRRMIGGAPRSSSGYWLVAHPRPHPHHQRRTQQHYFFSTQTEEESKKPGFFRGWMNDRKEKKEKEQYLEQMQRLSEMESLTLGNYQTELKRGLSGMAANIKVFQTKEIEVAQEVVAVVEKMIDVMGPDATADDLVSIGRVEKLKVATASNKTVEEIGIMISQVQNMDVMQKCLRKRKLEGKPIPQDAQAMQEAIKKEAREVMSRSQKEMIKKRQHTMAKRMARKKR